MKQASLRNAIAACVLILFILSCGGKRKYFTAVITSSCSELAFCDTLETVLFTNNRSDLGGKSNTFQEIFSAGRVYKKKLPKRNGHFYIDSVERAEYSILYIECYMHDALHFGYNNVMDFSDVSTDTFEVKVCIQPSMTIKQN